VLSEGIYPLFILFMSMVSILKTIVFCWISYWNIALNSLINVGRDMGSSTLGEARVDSVPRRACA